MTATALYEVPLGVCTQAPDRWTTTPDAEAKTLCRACPRRWMCARARPESGMTTPAQSPSAFEDSTASRAHALGRLRSLAERNGFPVRANRVSAKSA